MSDLEPISLPFAVRCRRFIASLAIMGLVWLVLLPWISERPTVARHIAIQQQLEIDPSAMFYTELKIANPIAAHIERLHDSYSTSFWHNSMNASAASVLDGERNPMSDHHEGTQVQK